MTSAQGFLLGYMSKQAAPGKSHDDYLEAVERMKKSKVWRLSGLAPSAGTFAGGYLGGRIGEWTADRRKYKDRIKRALWGAVMGAMVGGAAGTVAQINLRAPLKNRLARDILKETEGS